MNYAYSPRDTLIILADAFRESVHIVYEEKAAESDMKERPLLREDDIYGYLQDQWPVVNFYSLSYPLGDQLQKLMKTDFFSAENKNDTVQMIREHLNNMRSSAGKARHARLESAKFVLELISCAYDQAQNPGGPL